VSPVKYELSFISQKTAFLIVTAVKTSNLTKPRYLSTRYESAIQLHHVQQSRMPHWNLGNVHVNLTWTEIRTVNAVLMTLNES
jgi:hypothetical protein